ncbi:uncharacterized protein LOC144916861 [Branchiostoma floridae x Branchiostoma belcheri]
MENVYCPSADVRSFRGADVGSDHYLVRAKIKLKLKKIRKQNTTKPFDIDKLSKDEICQEFTLEVNNRFQALEDKVEPETQWKDLHETITQAAKVVIGRKRGTKKESWITPDTWKLIDTRREIKKKRDSAKTQREQNKRNKEYRKIDKEVKKHCKIDKNTWLDNKATEAQKAADRNDTRTLYRIARDLSGSNSGTGVPIKDKNGKTLLSEEEQNQRWAEHFKETLNQPEPQEVYTFPDVDGNELDVDCDNITEDEVANAIKNLKNHKAAGIDQISAELLKKGGDIMLKKLTKLCNTCWELGKTPLDWRKGAIVKLPKKGDLSDCGNWRGITLLSIPGKVDAGYTDSFDIVTGVRQGCVLSPLLFTVTIDFVMRRAMGRSDFGIPWEGDRRLTDLDFADDIALTAESQLTLQDMTTSAETEAGKVGLRISCQKTKVMQVGDQQTNTNLHISGEPVENVRQFTYLGSTMTAEGDTDTDISARIGKAASVFRRMNPVWNSGKISRVLKTKLLQSVVIPTALYACETWKITTRMRNKLDAFQQRCLRKILHITYRDRITNEEVYHRTGTKPLSITITERRMSAAVQQSTG